RSCRTSAACPTSRRCAARSRASRTGCCSTRSICSISTATTCAAPRSSTGAASWPTWSPGTPGGRILMSETVDIASTGAELLRLGRHEGWDLVYAGKVGTGFSVRTAQSVRARLEPLIRRSAPTAKLLRKKDTIWVEPKLSAVVELLDLTDHGQIRHGSFKGLT